MSEPKTVGWLRGQLVDVPDSALIVVRKESYIPTDEQDISELSFEVNSDYEVWEVAFHLNDR